MKQVNEKAIKEHFANTLLNTISGKSVEEIQKCHWFTWDRPDGTSTRGLKRKAA